MAVDVCFEARHDLAGVALDRGHYDLTRHVVVAGVRLGRLHHLLVVEQTVDENLAFGQTERFDFDVEVLADILQNPVDPAAEKPADAGNQQTVEHRPTGEHDQQHQQPEGDVHLH